MIESPHGSVRIDDVGEMEDQLTFNLHVQSTGIHRVHIRLPFAHEPGQSLLLVARPPDQGRAKSTKTTKAKLSATGPPPTSKASQSPNSHSPTQGNTAMIQRFLSSYKPTLDAVAAEERRDGGSDSQSRPFTQLSREEILKAKPPHFPSPNDFPHQPLPNGPGLKPDNRETKSSHNNGMAASIKMIGEGLANQSLKAEPPSSKEKEGEKKEAKGKGDGEAEAKKETKQEQLISPQSEKDDEEPWTESKSTTTGTEATGSLSGLSNPSLAVPLNAIKQNLGLGRGRSLTRR